MLSVCDGLEALTVRDYSTAFPFHFHQTYNISLVYDGSFRTKVRDRSLHAPPGSILITNPLEIHSNPCNSSEQVSFFTFYVSPDFLNSSASKAEVFFHDNVVYDDDLFSALHNITIGIENASATIEPALKSALATLSSKHGSFTDNSNFLGSTNSLFHDLLASEDLDKFSLEETAKKFGINKYKFLRLFKFQTGLTPANYFILKRIEKSKELLLAGQDLLSVASELGFYDVPHFSRHFKKFTGVSPVGYSSALF